MRVPPIRVTLMTLPHGYLRAGSVSLGAARKAARDVKASKPEDTKSSSALYERYLGHFGSSARKGAGKTVAGQALGAKKGAAKKGGAKKGTAKNGGVKNVSRAFASKKAATKKSSSVARRR